MKKIIPLLALLVLVSSCEKVIDFTGEDIEPKVVLISTASPDTTLTARLTLSRFFLDDRPYPIVNNAYMQLICNGAVHSVGTFSNGYYHFNYTPTTGDLLQLKVKAPGYDTIVANTSIPPYANIEELRYYQHPTPEGNDPYYTVYITINDPSPDNYYAVRLSCKGEHGIDDTIFYDNDTIFPYHTPFSYYLPFQVEDPLLIDVNSIEYVMDEPIYNYFSFSDETFNGKRHTIPLSINRYYPEDGDLYLTLYTLSEEYYRYLRSTTSSWDDLEILSEPRQVYSNINGGIGIFAGYNKKEYKIEPSTTAKRITKQR